MGQLPVPTLVWAAQNDPFLSPTSLPDEALSRHWPNVQTHFPTHGGHCGFDMSNGRVLLEALQPGGFWQHVLE
jgi:predicted alpha/beta-fold hydrolase